ncbi:MAG TPA: tRNA (adenosine(37)-N6)-threonylcarbamoyltransferase complex dimerization subunit type 1 TsaB [Longimicrobiales bacterium]
MSDAVYLAIETSTPLGSVAVGNGAGVLAEVVLGIHARHSEALLPAVDFGLRNAQVDKRELQRIVVGGGPGSFTGLRISAATAKALAQALGIPLFAYSGLAALAAGAGASRDPVCGLFDARRGEVYAACYRFPDFDTMETLLEPAPRKIDDVLGALDPQATVFVGDGALQNRAAIERAGGCVAPAHLAVPRASALLWLTDFLPTAGSVENVASWEPLYLRESGAERMRAR